MDYRDYAWIQMMTAMYLGLGATLTRLMRAWMGSEADAEVVDGLVVDRNHGIINVLESDA